MKKGLSSFIIILIILTLNSCAFLDNQSGTEYLDTKTFEVSESLYNSIRKKYNLTDDNNYVMESVFDYVGVLEKFDYKGRDLTAENIGVILGVDSEEELRQIYNKYYCDDFIESVGYIISFMQAIEIRATYYNSRKRGIIQLKDTINNPDINLDYDSLIWHYEDFVDEIEQSRVRSYTKKK